MPRYRLDISGHEQTVYLPPETLLLRMLREERALPGTEFGCVVGLCRTCTGTIKLPVDFEA